MTSDPDGRDDYQRELLVPGQRSDGAFDCTLQTAQRHAEHLAEDRVANSGNDVHTLTPTATSAASRQTDLTSTLRQASRPVPYGWVASNALAYKRPCLARIPKALAPRASTASTEIIAKSIANGRA